MDCPRMMSFFWRSINGILLKVVRELTSSFAQRDGIIQNLLPPRQRRKPPSTRPPWFTLAGSIAPAPNDMFWGFCWGFSSHLSNARNCSEVRIQVKSRPVLPLLEFLVVSSVIIAESLSFPWTASLKWSGSAPYPNSGRLIYLGFCFQGDPMWVDCSEANQYLIGSSRRTWKSNQITPTYLTVMTSDTIEVLLSAAKYYIANRQAGFSQGTERSNC